MNGATVSSSEAFLGECLLLDIETNENNEIYAIGSVYQGKKLQLSFGKSISRKQLSEIDALAAGAHFILGHNILAHDLPRLKVFDSALQLLKKPAIDTLYLSPLAFPENPYHRLVKDYQIVRDSINNPAEDAVLAGRIFREQWDAFAQQLAQSIDVPILYRSFLQTDEKLNGTAQALEAIGVPALSGDDLYEAFSWYGSKHACVASIQRIVDQLVDGKLDHPQFAYICAWLSVAGGNSVLPPWVRHRYDQIPSLLHQLREVPCRVSSCVYCSKHHDPGAYLKRYFGFDGFRETPASPEGKSLQEEIVQAAASSATIFATLPTGGGKSLCYLLPGLMRYERRNMLSIVISPLQALMKDQVDNFSNNTGTRIAAAIYGLQTLPERGAVQEGVRLGDIGILYVSPEQLRNKSFVATISQREIGAWIFDEAHCLSKWGHDFRPDYLYAIKFIRDFAVKEKSVIPPVQCFTATAKTDVRLEIIDLVQSELGLRVLEFEGGHERTNLLYEVWSITPPEKNQVILELVKARYDGTGSVVIYCSSRKKTEQIADFLQQSGYNAEAFHAGLEPSLKRRIQDNFIQGATPIICATNAFGMGIDKDDVRLVIHADIPGSLENYLQEAKKQIKTLNLSKRQQDRWMAILELLMARHSSKGFSADEIASLTSFGQQKDDPESESEAQRVIRTLEDMAQAGLLVKETTLSAFIRYKTIDSSKMRLSRLNSLENDFLKILQQNAPEADKETPLTLDLRQVNQQLIDTGHEYSNPQSLRILLYGLSRDGRGIAGQKGSLSVAVTGGDIYLIRLHRDWESLKKTVKIRQQAATVTLAVILQTVASDAKPNANLLVEFTLEGVINGVRKDLILYPQLKDPLAAAERALTFMHEQAVMDLQHGLAVFRQGMTLVLNEENKRRHYTKADFEPLQTHYKERNFQIHVMNEYAKRALDKLASAKNLVASYFRDDKAEFVKRYFAGREKYLELATTEQSYQHIVDDLHNRNQEDIVTVQSDANVLTLAGPGSGKTRVVAHRVAYLLRVKRVLLSIRTEICCPKEVIGRSLITWHRGAYRFYK